MVGTIFGTENLTRDTAVIQQYVTPIFYSFRHKYLNSIEFYSQKILKLTLSKRHQSHS